MAAIDSERHPSPINAIALERMARHLAANVRGTEYSSAFLIRDLKARIGAIDNGS